MSDSFEIKGRTFKAGKIDAFKQFHIVRRIGPIMADLAPLALKFGGKQTDSFSDEAALTAITPILNGVSKLSDEDANYVLKGLLAGAEIKSGGGWARVISADNQLMFEDLDLPTLIQVASKVFQRNVAGFFSALPQSSRGEE